MTRRLSIVPIVVLLLAAPAAAEEDRRAAYPNEPEGHVPWFSHDWQSWPAEHGQRIVASEAGLIRAGRSAGNFELVDDPDAPHGKGRSLRHRQMEGQYTGSTSGTFDLFHPRPDAGDSHRQEDQVKLRSVYRSHWVKFEPDPQTGDWQFGTTHMRTFWWNRFYTRGWANISLASPGSPVIPPHRRDHFRGARFWYYPSHTAGSEGQMVEPDGRYEVGQWYHFEYLWETEGNFGTGDAGLNDSRVRIWIDGDLKFDEIVTHYIEAPFAMEHFAMVWLGHNSTVDRHPQADVSSDGWTNQDGAGSGLFASINSGSVDDATYVQSPLDPEQASYVAELEIEEVPEHRPAAHRSATTYRYRKSDAGGQPIDLTVDLIKREGDEWEVIKSVTHEDIGDSVVEGEMSTPRRDPNLDPGRYALRFTADGGEGDARRAVVSWTRFRTTHTNRRTQDDFVRFGDIYISGVLHEEP